MQTSMFENIFDEASLRELLNALSVSLQVHVSLCLDITSLTEDDIKIMLGDSLVAGLVVEEFRAASGQPLSERLQTAKTTLSLLAGQLSKLGYNNLYLRSLVNSLENLELLHQQEREVLETLAEKDSLTGLYNRRKFEDVMAQYAKQTDCPICIISADANYLKMTNDIFGHEAGDKLLKKIADIMHKLSKKEWLVARCGGDEFRVLLPHTKLLTAMDYCKRVTRNCRDEKSLALPLSLALGAAEWNNGSETLQECFARADEEMYQNKIVLKQEQHLLDYILERLFDRQILIEDVILQSMKLSQAFAESLGLPPEQIHKLVLVAHYEDIGMAQLPEYFMIRGQSRTEEERKILENHVKRGYEMARQFEEIYQIADIILCCHENWAGNSYPRNLKGYQIPLEARIIRIVDNYCYWTVPTPFGSNFSKEEARRRLISQSGIMYDPDLVSKFIKFIDKANY